MPSPKQKTGEKFTYADYLTWPDNERWEIIEGMAYNMSPAPGSRHQDVSRELLIQFGSFLKGKQCKVYNAPFDVRFLERDGLTDDKIETVVQPDILVICDREKIDRRGCKGTPDLVVEIVSKYTSKNDVTVKFDLYQRHNVKEYWIVYPEENTLLVYRLGDDVRYGAADRYAGDDKVPVPLLGDLVIDLMEVFAE